SSVGHAGSRREGRGRRVRRRLSCRRCPPRPCRSGEGRSDDRGDAMTTPLRVSDEVSAALAAGCAIVALETTLISHGFSEGRGLAVALESEERVRAAGAVPAAVGVVDGAVLVGLDAAML